MVLDPRATYTVEDRRLQFELVNKLAALLNHMSWAVDAILEARDAAIEKKMPSLAEEVDKIRSKIVATKEGGAITGEERLREHVDDVYGAINSVEDRPTSYQMARVDALDRELKDVEAQWVALQSGDLRH